LKLARFLADLGSSKGTPGGGAAAALTGAAAASLVEMVSRLNDKRLKNNSGTTAQAAALRARLEHLIKKDGDAFERIQKLFGKRREQKTAWQAALKYGAGVPLEIAGASFTAARLASKEKTRTSRWLESDRREALILARAAFESANLNVEINLKELADATFNKRTRKRIQEWRRSFPRS
jgi:glutamate formiminotransferase/formiminotetrahydrofolate cyclodeaminase